MKKPVKIALFVILFVGIVFGAHTYLKKKKEGTTDGAEPGEDPQDPQAEKTDVLSAVVLDKDPEPGTTEFRKLSRPERLAINKKLINAGIDIGALRKKNRGQRTGGKQRPGGKVAPGMDPKVSYSGNCNGSSCCSACAHGLECESSTVNNYA